jgi:methylglutaconyl-CoA hydratase
MSYETLEVTIDDRGVARLTFNRPAKHNAMNTQFSNDMHAALAKLDDDPAVRVVVTTGAGESYSAGGDLGWMQEQADSDRAGRMAEARNFALMLRRLDNMRKPVIARVNGPAYGGGIGMISVSDIAIAADHCRFGLTEVRLGLIPATISPYVLARIGAAQARRWFINGRFFNAEQALQMGLLHEVVPADDLDAVVEKELNSILNAAPTAISLSKGLITQMMAAPAQDPLDFTIEQLADAWETDEAEVGIQAFFAKTSPPWRKS